MLYLNHHNLRKEIFMSKPNFNTKPQRKNKHLDETERDRIEAWLNEGKNSLK